MPIEIREIEIKATVDENKGPLDKKQPIDTTEEIIQEAVERVLEILKNRKRP